MKIFQHKYFLPSVVVFLFLLAFSLVFLLFLDSSRESKEEDVVYVLEVNGNRITEDQFEIYKREVSRNILLEGREEPSDEKIFEKAVNRAVKEVVAKEYHQKKGVTVSKEEVDERIRLDASFHPATERVDEFLRMMQMKGYSEDKLRRGYKLLIGDEKTIEVIAQGLDITDEELAEEYENFKAEHEDRNFLPLEEVYDQFKRETLYLRAREILFENSDKMREEAEVLIYD